MSLASHLVPWACLALVACNTVHVDLGGGPLSADAGLEDAAAEAGEAGARLGPSSDDIWDGDRDGDNIGCDPGGPYCANGKVYGSECEALALGELLATPC